MGQCQGPGCDGFTGRREGRCLPPLLVCSRGLRRNKAWGDAHAYHPLVQNRNAGLLDSLCAARPQPLAPPHPAPAPHGWTTRSSAQAAPSTSQMECDDDDDFFFFAADLPGSLFFPRQAGGSACWPPSAMPHSIVLYKQGTVAKIQKTLPRKKGKL